MKMILTIVLITTVALTVSFSWGEYYGYEKAKLEIEKSYTGALECLNTKKMIKG